MSTDSDGSGSFWKTLPGILTGIGTIVGSLAGVIGVLWQVGIIGDHTDDPPAAVVDVRDEPTGKALGDGLADNPPDDSSGGLQPAASEDSTIPDPRAEEGQPEPARPQPPPPPAPAPSEEAEPTVFEPPVEPVDNRDLGAGDAGLAALRAGCASGDMIACDELFFSAPLDSDDERFGWTCGGLIPEELTAGGDCERLFG